MAGEGDSGCRWLALLYQFPQKPGSLRMKIWRRLQRIGAVAVKNSVYVLPRNEQTQEDFEWILQEIISGGAEGMILEANFVDGMDDHQLHQLFDAARDEDYGALADEVRAYHEELPETLATDAALLEDAKSQMTKFKMRLYEVDKIDFFGANGREAAGGVVTSLAEKIALAQQETQKDEQAMLDTQEIDLIGKTWVTRQNVHVDRIASAWLIQRWIDADAKFKFTASKRYEPQENELRFDMFEAEVTHEGDNCTFEVLLSRAKLNDPSLKRIGEIIHDIDLKDSKYGHEETLGIEHLLTGLSFNIDGDDERIERGGAIFDDLYQYFRAKK